MDKNSFKVLFFVSRTKVTKNGEIPILMRITVAGQRVNMYVKRTVEERLWDAAKGMVKGNSRVAVELNHFLETERLKVYKIHRELEMERELVTLEKVHNRFLGKHICNKTILELFKEHNQKCEKLVGKDFSANTAERYRTTARYVGEFIQKFYKKPDLLLQDVDGQFVTEFDFFLKTEKNCCQNSAIKHHKGVKKLVRIALANEWMKRDPFLNFKFHIEAVEKEFLTEEELNIIITKQFPIERVEAVRDVFIFCCFTGLAFVDVQQLTREHIVADNKGKMWIRKPRQKTKNMCNIPLMEIPLSILAKYENHPDCVKKGVALPVMCNQKMNAYLKEIADLCGISKNFTTHTARHSFATSVALANGVSIESVSKMLGHSNTKMTQHYARILDRTVSAEMEGVSDRFAKF